MKILTKLYKRSSPLMLVAGFFLFMIASFSYAEDMCPAINCDCKSLPVDAWQNVCSSYEAQIKLACQKNGGQPTKFCSIHGPSASPLPLALKLKDVSILPEDEIKSVHKQTEMMFWSIHSDMETIVGLIKKGEFGKAQGSLKIVDRNINSLFNIQRQVTLSFEVNDKEGAAISAWKEYSEKTLKEAGSFKAVGEEMWQARADGDSKYQKAYPILAMKIFRMSSKLYEMAAYGYSGTQKDDIAAQVWHVASDLSRQIMEGKIALNAEPSHVDYYRHQAAMRLHRASYHWMLDKEEDDAKKTLYASVKYMEDKGHLSELLREPGEREIEEKVANSPY